jgi:uncharacterized protein (TIGR01777 family)
MEVVVAGASGLLGSALRDSLRRDGHRVKQLVRHSVSEPDMDSWDPSRGLLDPDFLRGADAVVCLSGAGVAGRRWNDDYKQTIRASRIDSVGTVARTLAASAVSNGNGVAVFIAASAVGYYGDTGDRETDETGPPGDTFLSRVCVDWEAAAQPARGAGVRVAHLRTGHVLAKQGDLMKKLVPIVKAGIGGRMGDGRQYMPWISLRDHVAAVRFLLENDVSGPVNIVGPRPVTNAEFMKTLGSVLHRPTLLPAPRFGARLVGGELADEAFIGQRAVPRKLLDAGFSHTDATLEAALRSELG